MRQETGRRSPSSSHRRSERGAYVSPDNRWIAYMSNETGRDEIYVQPFSVGGSKASGKWMVSRGTRGMARWRADSKELMFVNGDGEVVAVDVAAGPAFQAQPPKKLFQMPLELLSNPNPGTLADAHTRQAAAADGDAGAGKRTTRARRRAQLAGRPEAIM